MNTPLDVTPLCGPAFADTHPECRTVAAGRRNLSVASTRCPAPPLPQQAGDLVEGSVDVGVDRAALLDEAAREQVQADAAGHAAAQVEVWDLLAGDGQADGALRQARGGDVAGRP